MPNPSFEGLALKHRIERDALLKAVAKEPLDDRPRLAFAAWLEQHADKPGGKGQEDIERAEFIRTQCEIAKQTNYWERTVELYNLISKHPSLKDLVARQEELIGRNFVNWVNEDLGGPCNYLLPARKGILGRIVSNIKNDESVNISEVPGKGGFLYENGRYRINGGSRLHVRFDRGFIHEIMLDVNNFNQHSFNWCLRNPIEIIRIDNVPTDERDAWIERIFKDPHFVNVSQVYAGNPGGPIKFRIRDMSPAETPSGLIKYDGGERII